MIELLSPAGNKDAFLAAINNGANAVYLGLKKFSARGNADNFNEEDLKYCVNYAKLFGVKVYAAVNTLVKNDELQAFFEFIGQALSAGVDAVILQDMFLGKTLKEIFPDIVLHLSTQAGVCNILGAKIAKEYGFSRGGYSRNCGVHGNGSIRAGGALFFFFGALLYEFVYRRQQRQQGAM